jgi:hypothetical protein
VASRLRQDAFPRVHEKDGQRCRGGTGRHVARVLFVPGRVGNDERPDVGAEEAIRDVDRDALLALGLQAVDEQREIQRLALRAELARVAPQGLQLIVRHAPAVVQQPADQRRLPIVDTAAGNEAERRRRQK